jgi:hypothetical protein
MLLVCVGKCLCGGVLAAEGGMALQMVLPTRSARKVLWHSIVRVFVATIGLRLLNEIAIEY